ncbi:MAG: hypothetical protein R3A52_09015 [Polyangiales bacterium]
MGRGDLDGVVRAGLFGLAGEAAGEGRARGVPARQRSPWSSTRATSRRWRRWRVAARRSCALAAGARDRASLMAAAWRSRYRPKRATTR